MTLGHIFRQMAGKRRLGMLLLVCLLNTTPGQADSDDHEEALRAVARGELRPLSEILALIEQEFGGRVLEVDLDRTKAGALIYEIEILMENGRVLELEYDGSTGKRLSVKQDD